jgi:hypothetical protein
VRDSSEPADLHLQQGNRAGRDPSYADGDDYLRDRRSRNLLATNQVRKGMRECRPPIAGREKDCRENSRPR